MKALHNSDVSGTHTNVPDVQVFGDGDLFKLISKASSKSEGWMKSTKAMEISGVGCIVQVTTQQRNPDGSHAVAEAISHVPFVKIEEELDEHDVVVSRRLVRMNHGAWVGPASALTNEEWEALADMTNAGVIKTRPGTDIRWEQQA